MKVFDVVNLKYMLVNDAYSDVYRLREQWLKEKMVTYEENPEIKFVRVIRGNMGDVIGIIVE